MSDMLKRLIEKRANTWEQAKAHLDTVEKEGREFTGEADETWGRLNGELSALDQRIAEVNDLEERNVRADEVRSSFEGRTTAPEVEGANHVEDELRSFLRGERREFEAAPERRDLTKGTTTAGGHTVKTSFYERLVEHMIEVSGVLAAGPTVLNTSSGENIDVPITTGFSTGALTAEAAAISESDPAFSKRTLGAYKYGTLIQVSRELVDDTSVDLLGFLGRQAGRAVGNALGVHLVTGSGSSQPAGIVTGSSAGVTGGTGVAGVFTADNLIDLYYSVIAPYRNSPSASWLMRDATEATVRKLKDSNNNYIWQPSLQVGAPSTLLGKPIHTDPNVAATAVSAKSVVFGDIAAYWVRLAGGVRFERSDEYAFNTDLVTFKAVVRGDGILVDQTGAVKHFVGAGT